MRLIATCAAVVAAGMLLVGSVFNAVVSAPAPKMTFQVVSRRLDPNGSVAHCKDATLTLDTALAGR